MAERDEGAGEWVTAPDAPPVAPPDVPASPVTGAERIGLLDALRGVALLGILPMNVPSFAYSTQAFFDPSIQGGFRGANFLLWLLGHLLFDFKMITIFSALFGAGIVLFTQRAEARGGRPGELFTRRMTWLGVIGLLHAYLVWEGDVLFIYAVAGAAAYAFRRLRSRWLVAIACVALLQTPLSEWGYAAQMTAAREAHAALERGEALDARSAALAEAYPRMMAEMRGSAAEFERERAAFTGGYFGLCAQRARLAALWQFWYFPLEFFGRVFGVMLLGMAALKAGVLTGGRSARWYGAAAAVGYLVGLPLIAAAARVWLASGLDPVVRLQTSGGNYVGSLFVAAGHVGLVALLVRSGAMRRAVAGLRAVGRMALTNYLAQSLLCAGLFYGYGFGLWGTMDRAGLWGVVAAICALQLAWSVWWLRRFRFGPAEWAWRSLTYWRAQPMRR